MNKIQRTYRHLLKRYGKQRWWPIAGKYSGGPKNKAEKFEVCIGAILAQSTSWKNVERALENLRKAKALNKKALERIPAAKLAKLIKPAGYYNQKTRKLKEFARFHKSLKGKEPAREQLLDVWGIGPETADSILLYAHNKPFFVVDAYTRRILSRLGVCKNADDLKKCSYDTLQQLFHKKLPRNAKMFNEFHALLVEHGKRLNKKKISEL
jgi:endonuclease-3 related protein